MMNGVRRAAWLIAGLAPLLLTGCAALMWPMKPAPDPQTGEVYILPWPAEEKWRMTEQVEDGVRFSLFAKGNEWAQNADETGFIARFPLPKGISRTTPLAAWPLRTFESFRQDCPAARFAIVDMDTLAATPWIIYTQICPGRPGDEARSKVYQVIAGNETIYVCDRTIKATSISDAKLAELVAFFRSGHFELVK